MRCRDISSNFYSATVCVGIKLADGVVFCVGSSVRSAVHTGMSEAHPFSMHT